MTDKTLPDIGNVTTETIDGLQIRLARSGSQDRPALLFTSPWPESIYGFHRVLSHFRDTHFVIAMDLPGFGHSESRPDIMSPKAMGAFLAKAAKHLGLDPLHGVGPDVGAPAFLFAALDNPGLFESLSVGGAATRVDLAGARLKSLIDSPTGAFAAIDGANAVSEYLAQAAGITPPAIIEDFRAASAGQRFENAVQYVRAYKDDLPLLEHRLGQIHTPVLVIAGKNDPIVPPPNNHLLAEHLPRNRLLLVEAGHRVWEEAAEEYSEQIASWIQGGYRAV
jgi:pimeloyl-ACP methyl ester carboxylesterase